LLAELKIIIEYEREEKLKAFNRDVCWEMLLSFAIIWIRAENIFLSLFYIFELIGFGMIDICVFCWMFRLGKI
jgi:hypothetical protein